MFFGRFKSLGMSQFSILTFQDTTIDGLKMKKGSTAIVLVHYLHRNPTIWENPEEFRPERFLDYK